MLQGMGVGALLGVFIFFLVPITVETKRFGMITVVYLDLS